MSTVSERLEKIIKSQIPSEVVFKVVAQTRKDSVFLSAQVTKQSSVNELPDDKELQTALSKELEESWDSDKGRYYINSNVDQLWNIIKRNIAREYLNTSKRCDATIRKTEKFILGVKIDDKFLPNYLIQVFLKIRSPAYENMSEAACEEMFEQFESLRRTYGKRNLG